MRLSADAFALSSARFAPPRRRWKSRSIFRSIGHVRTLGLLVVAGLIGAAGYLGATGGGRHARAAITVLPAFDRVAQVAGFGIDEVTLAGHVFTPDTAIYDALDLENVRTFAALDVAAVMERIGRLPWVATAELRREFPGRLEVRITERQPFAVWSRDGQDVLIDRTGRVLSAINTANAVELPRFSGEGANAQAAALIAFLERYPNLRQRLEIAEWVGNRRWTLHLAGGVDLHLPADREAPALAEIASRLDAMIARPNRIVDLRAPGRMTVRSKPEAQVSSAIPLPVR